MNNIQYNEAFLNSNETNEFFLLQQFLLFYLIQRSFRSIGVYQEYNNNEDAINFHTLYDDSNCRDYINFP